jgi:hypothetical protein
MAETLISTRLLEIISSRYAENAKRPGKRYFQTSKAISTNMDAEPTGKHRGPLFGWSDRCHGQ